MSYDLRIYTILKQNLKDLLKQFNTEMNGDNFVIPLKNHQIVINSETPIEDEDIPQQVSMELPGLKYIIECNLEPITDDEKLIKQLIKLGKAIAKNGIGIIENPQTDEIIKPSGIKRVIKTEKTERFSILELSWWFNHENLLKEETMSLFLSEINRLLPEALPRRYGLYEPPKENFITLDTFKDYLTKNVKESIVWYPSKPVEQVSLNIPPFIGAMKWGYRFGYFSISIDARVLSMSGWKTQIIRLFKSISQILCPFYGDIYVLENYIYSRRSPCSDNLTQYHPIVSWWWNGIPRKLGLGIVIGNPLLSYAKIKRKSIELNNGCVIILGVENENYAELSDEDIEVPENLYQPKTISKVSVIGHTGKYPALWLFDGPFDK